MHFRPPLVVAFVRCLLLGSMVVLLLAPEARGQAAWQRTVTLIVPVERDGAPAALADSAVALAEAQAVSLRRSPSAAPSSLPALRDALAAEGLSVRSATHVFLTYRFVLRAGTLHRRPLHAHFIYRPPQSQRRDRSVLYVNLTEDPVPNALLVERGLRSARNEAMYHPFREQISFSALHHTGTVVKVGTRVIRDSTEATAVEQRILATLRSLAYR